MIIGVDARPLEAKPTGIGVYTREILSRTPTDARIVLYSNKPIAPGLPHEIRESLGITGPVWRNSVLPKQLEQDGVDVYWSPIGTLPLVSIQAKTVITIHDLLWIDYPQTLTLRDRIGRRLQMRRSILRADNIIAVSDFTRSRLLESYGLAESKVSVITESTRFKDSSPGTATNRSKNIIVFGGSELRKNVQFLIDSFQISELPAQEWKLIVVGKGSAALRASDRVELQEYLPDDLLTGLLETAGAMCFPSLYEGFGLPILEAMAFDIPVLASDIPPFREFELPSAAMFDPSDRDDCVLCLQRLMEDGFADNILERQRHVLRNWPTWAHVAQQTFDLMQRVLGESLGEEWS